MRSQRIKVLVVDDSAIVRKLLSDALKVEPDIEVVGGAGDPFVARDMILRFEPDVITLDIEMPRMDGISFLRTLMAHRPMPVIIISSLTQSGSATTIEALRAGAIDVLAKPGSPTSVGELAARLKDRVRAVRGMAPAGLARAAAAHAAAPAPVSSSPVRFDHPRRRRGIIAIGASTGGPQAIESLLTRMPAETPPIVIAQHMPAGFTKAFAGRLDRVCKIRVVESAGGEVLEPGVAYLAPGGHHLAVDAHGVRLTTRLHDGPQLHHQRPAVDELFNSLARLGGVPIVAALLTGMGADGAEGLLALRKAGAETIAEDEISCIVFGMPREAIARDAAMHVATLLRMPTLIAECFARVASTAPAKAS
jgi:two-component system, chemotaxis family, protein-glutamate methylesterase/glutaminase